MGHTVRLRGEFWPQDHWGRVTNAAITREQIAQPALEAAEEAADVARACGVKLPPDLAAQILKIPAAMPNQTSSTAQDLARGKPTEIDHLNGYVVRRGAALRISTPVNHTLLTLVKLREAHAKA